ncbi:peptide chain release factor 2 [Candidatus Aerophobetes bacterium]|uniref:Peptide chain release factor 2 n=1 Tax=Aerophobetes bacterium TaxID=2030807 RepID=A0A2A4YIQ7_UNCAE|nr:MAG: peptide chain release factor 2 [Candidatus Aerophobetes bacterium]
MICGGIFDLANKTGELAKLEEQMGTSNFWDNNIKATRVIEEANKIKSWSEPYNLVSTRYDALNEMLQEVDETDEVFYEELVSELVSITTAVEELEVKRMLSGELDDKDCFIMINAGAGGTEACDWALMLSRMYQRWAAKRKWKVEIVDSVDGDVAGIKSVTLNIHGPFAYGYAKAEKGVHRLVRISPFDSNSKRHTSFASVDVIPEIKDDIQIEIRPEDVRVDTFRASGAGGQHINTTDSAVRVTHIPTKIVVSCQNERSQLQNKETCFKILKSKLYEREVLEREQAIKGGEKKEIAWGSQIRNYVFQPYTLVKDTRTKFEKGNIQDVMDGAIDEFITAFLKEFG